MVSIGLKVVPPYIPPRKPRQLGATNTILNKEQKQTTLNTKHVDWSKLPNDLIAYIIQLADGGLNKHKKLLVDNLNIITINGPRGYDTSKEEQTWLDIGRSVVYCFRRLDKFRSFDDGMDLWRSMGVVETGLLECPDISQNRVYYRVDSSNLNNQEEYNNATRWLDRLGAIVLSPEDVHWTPP